MTTLNHALDCICSLYSQIVEQPTRLVPTLLGAPGIGKTTGLKELGPRICAENNIDPDDYEFVEVRLADMDPTEICGIPFVVDGTVQHLKPAWFPKKNHGMIYLTEYGQAMTATQNASTSIMREMKAGPWEIPPGFMVVADTNRKKDKAGIAARIPTHVQDRMIQFHIVSDVKTSQQYAIENDWHEVIPYYWNYRPENLNKINDEGFGATQRSWEFVSDIKKADHNPDVETTLILATIGEEIGTDYLAFETVFELLPNIGELIADPMGAAIDHKPNVMYALMGALSTAMARDYNKATAVIKYLDRIEQEWAFACIADAQRFNTHLINSASKNCAGILGKSPAYTEWLVAHKDVYL